MIRYDTVDVGARPIPPSDVWWESPDIGIAGGNALGEPTGEQPVTLQARVWNLGAVHASPVRVDFAFIAPSLGILSGAPELIGSAWTTVLAGQSALVECPTPWIPPAYPTDLHACLLVTCTAPLQGDTPTVPGSPILDRHVGQHNLTVLEADGGDRVPLRLAVANPTAFEAAVQLAGAAAWHTDRPDEPTLDSTFGVLAATRAAAGATTLPQARMWSKRAGLVTIQARSAQAEAQDVTDLVEVRSIDPEEPVPPSSVVVWPPALIPAAGFCALGPELKFLAGQTASAEVVLHVPAPSRAWLAVHLAQRTGGQLTGGYTILVRMNDFVGADA